MSQTDLPIDLTQANTMLYALAPNDGAFTFQTFADGSNKSKLLIKQFHGNLDQHASDLTQLNQQGAGVFVTINSTDGKGRKSENITAIRALFVDFDTPSNDRLSELLSLEFEYDSFLSPSLIVESSKGKHHAYWLCDGIPLDSFTDYQKRLISFFDSLGDTPDKGIHNKDRVMRLAGFYHNKGEPVLTKIVYPVGGQDIQRYSYDELKAMVDSLPAPSGQTSQRQANTSKAIISDDNDDFTKDDPLGLSLAEIKHYLSLVTDDDNYDKWFKVGMILHHEFKGGHDGLELWDDWASQFNKYDGYDIHASKWETFNSARNAKPITFRTLIEWAKQNPNFKPYQLPPSDIDKAREIISELATLDTLEYALQSKAKAKLLGITLPMLDKAVKEAKAEIELTQMVSIVADVEPYTDPVDGQELAGEIYQVINNHIACDDVIAVAVTLWVFFSWCVEVSYVAPIAWINAPEKRCGKTQLATLIGRMSKNAINTTNITPAALFRCIDRYTPTLVIDEADSFMNDNEDLRGIINAGFSRDNCYLWRCVGDSLEPMPFNVYGAKVISGIGKLPHTIMDRSISLTLRRAMKHEKKQRLRDLPKSVTDTIKAKLSRWTNDNIAMVATAKPHLPESIYNRDFDTWEILFQIADTLGGNWLDRITNACLAITGNEPTEPSINEQLLTDIKTIFTDKDTDRLATTDLIEALTFDIGDGEAMRWATHNMGKPLTAKQLASRLKQFNINNKPLRINGEVKKGYDLNDFKDAFNRYLS